MQRKHPGSGWTIGDVTVQVVSSFEHAPALIGALRRGNDYMATPCPFLEPVKRLYP